MTQPKRLILGVTIGGSSRLLDGQAAYFRELGYDVYLVSQDHFKEPIFCKKEGIKHLPVDIDSEINPLKDLRTLWQILRYFRKLRPDIVNVGTPKMGLLGVLAARILGVRNRIYTCRGLRFETEQGVRRRILMAMERLTVRLAHRVVYVSPSLKDAALHYGVCNPAKAVVIGAGSSNGVHLEAYQPERIDAEKKAELIRRYALEDCLVIGFVGRVTLHKGAYELVTAFERLYQQHQKIRLVLMGHIKCDTAFEARFRAHPGIIHIPFQDDVPLYMSLFDIFVLPSWREGFPNVPIQAAAMGLPVVVSDATGCIDSVKAGVNGQIFQQRDGAALEAALLKYIDDPALRRAHGAAGPAWAAGFRSEVIWQGLHNLYLEQR